MKKALIFCLSFIFSCFSIFSFTRNNNKTINRVDGADFVSTMIKDVDVSLSTDSTIYAYIDVNIKQETVFESITYKINDNEFSDCTITSIEEGLLKIDFDSVDIGSYLTLLNNCSFGNYKFDKDYKFLRTNNNSWNLIIDSAVSDIEIGDNFLIVSLMDSDYMLAPYSEGSLNWGENVTSEQRYVKNPYSVLIDSFLSSYNFSSKILFDGTPLSHFSYVTFINMWQRPNTIGFQFDVFPDGISSLSDFKEIDFSLDTTLPSLTRCYYKDNLMKTINLCAPCVKKIGSISFDGYESNKIIDANKATMSLTSTERYPEFKYFNFDVLPFTSFISTPKDSAFKSDSGYLISTNSSSSKNKLLILEFLHPIDSNLFQEIEINLYANYNKILGCYNFYNISENNLGDRISEFKIDQYHITSNKLSIKPFADTNGVVDKIVLQLETDGGFYTDDVLYVSSFSVKSLSADFAVYYDGNLVKNGDELISCSEVHKSNVAIIGEQSYKVSEKVNDSLFIFSVINDQTNEEVFSFKVTQQLSVIPEEKSNNTILIVSIVGGSVVCSGLIAFVIIFALKKRRINEK